MAGGICKTPNRSFSLRDESSQNCCLASPTNPPFEFVHLLLATLDGVATRQIRDSDPGRDRVVDRPEKQAAPPRALQQRT
jgi:hypothetical protein